MEVFLLHETFYQFKNLEYLQLRRRHIFYRHMHSYLSQYYEASKPRAEGLEAALAAVEAGASPSENQALAAFCKNQALDWQELQQTVLASRDYHTPDFERQMEACHERIGKLQKMLNAASLTPAIKRRLEAQARFIENDLQKAEQTIEHLPGESIPPEPIDDDEQPDPTQRQSA